MEVKKGLFVLLSMQDKMISSIIPKNREKSKFKALESKNKYVVGVID